MQKIDRKPWGEQEAYNRLSALCARQECCHSDLALKMARRGMDDTSIAHILQQLEDEGYIDEERYCRAFVHDKLLFAHWGRNRIRMELHRKGISHETYSSALEDIDEEDYRQVLLNLLAEYRKQVTGRCNSEVRAKLIRYAINRGFESSLAISILDDWEEE